MLVLIEEEKKPLKDSNETSKPHCSLCRSTREECSAEVGTQAPAFEKSVTKPELKSKPNLLRGKNTFNITTFNIRTLNTVNQLHKLSLSAVKNNINIICVEKHRYKLATLVKKKPKDPFSIATTLRCRGGCYSLPWIAPLYPWSLLYNIEC